jgi:hypothetical protein
MKFILLLLLLITYSISGWSKKIALVSSGGVSLGSYEAGILQEFLHSHKKSLPQDLRVVVGASAGGINGLLTIFEACRAVPSTDKDGLLWKMWIPVGLDQLQDDNPNHKGLFQRNSLQNLFQELRGIWHEGFKDSCDIIFGVTVTRRNPLVEEIRPGLSITRQPEIFFVRIKGRGKGRSPTVENYTPDTDKTYRTLLPLNESKEKQLELLLDLVQASAAFPVAFKSYPLKYCIYRPGEVVKSCDRLSVRKDEFVDGGIYQNSPVDRGFHILKRNYPSDKNIELIYVNASAPLKSDRIHKEDKSLNEDQGSLGEIYSLGLSFLNTSRNMSLSENLKRFPELSLYLKTNPKNYPLASEPLYAFLGFVEKDFRISDFYLGINDGQEMFQSSFSDPEVDCFHMKLKTGEANCKINKNLLILADLANSRKNHYPLRESTIEIFKYLEEAQFHFKDLGLDRKRSQFGRIALKERFRKLGKAYEEKQPKDQQEKIKFVVEQSLNQISFYPSSFYRYILLGKSPEFGLSTAWQKEITEPTSLRFNMALMLIDFMDTIHMSDAIWAPVPLVGLRYQPKNLGNLFWQYSFGLRAGYVLSNTDDYGESECYASKSKLSHAACSGLIIQKVFSVTFLERLRAQVVISPDAANSFGKFENSQLYFQVGMVFPGF